MKVAFLAHDPKLEVKKSYADMMEKQAIRDLVREKKGILILDLDHTLFQVTLRQIAEEVQGLETWSFETEMEHTGRLMEGKTYWFNLESIPKAVPFFLHLRPALYSFLGRVASMFELYAYTQGTSEYAKKILGGIDPSGEFFGTPFRLIARELDPETGRTIPKNLSRVFPNEEGLVLIIDDRDDVWDEGASENNLIKLTPFVFFPDKDREKLIESWFKPRVDDRIVPHLRDDQLVHLERLLSEIHSELYFSNSQEPLANPSSVSLTAVLAGHRSRLFENVEFIKNHRVNNHILKLAKQFGASFVALPEAGRSGKLCVYVGVPDQARRGSDPDLIHPWYILFAVSTFSIPPPENFSIARIEADNITNMWECMNVSAAVPSEEDLLEDLLLLS